MATGSFPLFLVVIQWSVVQREVRPSEKPRAASADELLFKRDDK